MKVREIQEFEGGIGGTHLRCRVYIVPDGEPVPASAVQAPEDTPEHDWQIGNE